MGEVGGGAGGEGGSAKNIKRVMYAFSVAGFVTLGVVINGEIVLHFEQGAVVASRIDFSPISILTLVWNQNGACP